MSDDSGLSRAFRAAWPEGTVSESWLVAFVAAGRASWPTVSLDALAFAGRLGAIAARNGALPDAAFAGDLYLASACALDAPGAAATFERAFGKILARAVARIHSADAFVDDVIQIIRVKLLVARPGSLPKIADYGGRAPLGAWLRAVAVRAAVSAQRADKARPHEPLELALDRAAQGSADVRYMRERYAGEFTAALAAAMARLTPRERTILRMHWVDGLSIDVLGAHYRIGRSTAARWIAAARQSLIEWTREDLRARLGVTSSELDSLTAIVRSEIDVNAAALLASR